MLMLTVAMLILRVARRIRCGCGGSCMKCSSPGLKSAGAPPQHHPKRARRLTAPRSRRAVVPLAARTTSTEPACCSRATRASRRPWTPTPSPCELPGVRTNARSERRHTHAAASLARPFGASARPKGICPSLAGLAVERRRCACHALRRRASGHCCKTSAPCRLRWKQKLASASTMRAAGSGCPIVELAGRRRQCPPR